MSAEQRETPRDQGKIAEEKIEKYFEGAMPGDVKLLALGDWNEKDSARDDLAAAQKHTAEAYKSTDSLERIKAESELRIAEMVYVSIKSRSSKRSALIPGYDSAYVIIEKGIHTLAESYSLEGASNAEAYLCAREFYSELFYRLTNPSNNDEKD